MRWPGSVLREGGVPLALFPGPLPPSVGRGGIPAVGGHAGSLHSTTWQPQSPPLHGPLCGSLHHPDPQTPVRTFGERASLLTNRLIISPRVSQLNQDGGTHRPAPHGCQEPRSRVKHPPPPSPSAITLLSCDPLSLPFSICKWTLPYSPVKALCMLWTLVISLVFVL